MQNKLYVLGTGAAQVTKCYNTCFTLFDGREHFLVDTGGGNGILTNLEKMNIGINQIHNVFISHKHTDHLFGVFWIIRNVALFLESGKYGGDLNIYCHSEVVEIIKTISDLSLLKKQIKYIGGRIKIISVKEREKVKINNYELEIVDMLSGKDLQYGFVAKLDDGKKLVFLGDEPYKNNFDELIKNCDWLLSEAFCLYNDREIFKPYEKHHNTVKESSEIAERLGAKNLVLWHTEDKNLKNRKELYTNEAREYFQGNVYVPNDLEILNL